MPKDSLNFIVHSQSDGPEVHKNKLGEINSHVSTWRHSRKRRLQKTYSASSGMNTTPTAEFSERTSCAPAQISKQGLYVSASEESTLFATHSHDFDPLPKCRQDQNYQTFLENFTGPSINLAMRDQDRRLPEDALPKHDAKLRGQGCATDPHYIRSGGTAIVTHRRREEYARRSQQFVCDRLCERDMNYSTLDPFFRLADKVNRREQGLVQFFLTYLIQGLFGTRPGALICPGKILTIPGLHTNKVFLHGILVMSEAFLSNYRQQERSKTILKHRAASYKALNKYLNDPHTPCGEMMQSFMPMIFADLVLGEPTLQTMHLEALDRYVEMQGGFVSIFLGPSPPSYDAQYLAAQYALAQYRMRDFATLDTMRLHLLGSMQLIQKLNIVLKDLSAAFQIGNTRPLMSTSRTGFKNYVGVSEALLSFHIAKATNEDFLRPLIFHPSHTPSASASIFGLFLSFGLALVELSPSLTYTTRFFQRFRDAVEQSVAPEPETDPPLLQSEKMTAMLAEVRQDLFYEVESRDTTSAKRYHSASLMAIMSKVRQDVFYEMGTKESSKNSEVRICHALVCALKVWPAMSPRTKAHILQHLRGWLIDGEERKCTCAVSDGNFYVLSTHIVEDWFKTQVFDMDSPTTTPDP